MQCRRENLGILENCPVERNDAGLAIKLLVQAKLVRQEIEL
jgi:hypothetical protein